ncbi:MalY/PatB family protein [Tropicimonas isoalkanivorans]|uniref:cysteine-S-conjugate beta-lyase n=1 Tax=Tropicimonas isoalkanivorans TaxID=441112 RepID=A0A1I1PAN5_9RHOB|nr:MalY/PatB family protein [Tropicimonas isoalkanivorans]SFD06795.1 cystathione beta-lyase [Tropicimonas isoalkanivorans]
MSFDEIIDRNGSRCLKWDMMEERYGVPAEDGIAMWVADMDFRPPQSVRDALQGMVDHGVFGYYGDERGYRAAICWWMKERHGWEVDPSWIFTTSGLVNGVAICLEAFTERGDGVILFTPVYHAFSRVIRASERQVVECELPIVDGAYAMDFDAWDAQMTGQERMLILCSPHNPGGRVWTREELNGIAEFAKRHDLLIVSDEIHHDLVYPGAHHIPMATLPGIADRLVMLTAPSKTFNIAGTHTGQVIIEDPSLRKRFGKRMAGLGKSPNSFGLVMTEAAYSPAGAAWVDDLVTYLDGNRQVFDDAVNAIPGLRSMPLEATYLAWVDFAGTGMAADEFTARVEKDARIAPNHGPTFGKGGETFLRFNFGTPRSRVTEAAERLTAAFADLQ